MDDNSCTAFLQWALPRLHLRWQGFERVRRQVCGRIRHRLATLQLDALASYPSCLEKKPQEWDVLDSLCRVTISRFCRNLAFACFDAPLQQEVVRNLHDRIAPGGTLIIGKHETLRPGAAGPEPWAGRLPVYRKTEGQTGGQTGAHE